MNSGSEPRTVEAFLKATTMGASALIAAPAVLRGAVPTADPVRVGHIGTGTRGWDLIKYTGASDSAKVVAVCDVYKPHLRRGVKAAHNPDVKTYLDYRDLLADPKVEAVIIATPDHWHEQMLIDACNAGKAVYCEKGWTVSIAAAKRMRDVVRKKQDDHATGAPGAAVCRFGRWRQDDPRRQARDRSLSSRPAGISTTRPTSPSGGGMAITPTTTGPIPSRSSRIWTGRSGLGSLPKIDFNERHFWHWRCYWPYGTGQAGDLLSHEMDYVQSVLGYGIPDTCTCAGLNAFWRDDRQVPDTWIATYQFEKQGCTAIFEGIQNSSREQTPEFCGRDARMVFNSIGQDASRFEVYKDGPAWTMGGRTPELV